MKLTLPSGATYGFNSYGERVCTGSQMGRRNVLPQNTEEPCKLRLTRLPFIDGSYDKWGSYWGSPANVWCAWGDVGEVAARVFVRADSRTLAKQGVRSFLPQAKFYR